MDKYAFVKGFLETAEQAGVLNVVDRLTLHKAANEHYYNLCKSADLLDFFPGSISGLAGGAGPITNLTGAFLAANALGAGLGSNYTPISNKELEQEMAYSEDPSISKALKYVFVPGYAGYRAAKTNRLENAYQKYRDDRRAQSAQTLAAAQK